MKLIYVLFLFLFVFHPTVSICSEILNTPIETNADGNTIPHMVIMHGGGKSLFQTLPGIDIKTQNYHGESIFLFGIMYSDLDTIQFMDEMDPSAFDLHDNSNRSPLLAGLQHQRPLEIIQFIHKRNPQALYEADKEGNLPLHYAFRHSNDVEVIYFIYKLHPKAILTLNKQGKTPHDLMRTHMGNLTLAQLSSHSGRRRYQNHNQGMTDTSDQCQQSLRFHRRQSKSL